MQTLVPAFRGTRVDRFAGRETRLRRRRRNRRNRRNHPPPPGCINMEYEVPVKDPTIGMLRSLSYERGVLAALAAA